MVVQEVGHGTIPPGPLKGENGGRSVARGQGEINLIVEVTGEKKKDKEAKVSRAKTVSVPAVNNHGRLGRWAFVEVRDPWDCKAEIRAAVAGGARNGRA